MLFNQVEIVKSRSDVNDLRKADTGIRNNSGLFTLSASYDQMIGSVSNANQSRAKVRDGTIPCPVPSRGTGSGTGRVFSKGFLKKPVIQKIFKNYEKLFLKFSSKHE